MAPPFRTMDDPLATEADTLRRNAALRPDHLALLFGDRRTGYATLDLRSNAVANGLLARGSAGQQRIALLTRNNDWFFEILFGSAKAGHVALPVNWRLAPREIAHILRDAGATCLFIGPDFADTVPTLRALGVPLPQVIVLDDAGYVTWRDSQQTADPLIDVSPDDIFIQLYTSGTTGHPKGVQISHRASLAMRRIEVSTGGLWTDWSAADVAIVAMPNFHVGGTSWALQWLARGATCVVQAQVDPREMLEAIGSQGVTQLFAVPTVLGMMLDDESCTARNFSGLKYIHYGAAPIDPDLLLRCMDRFGCGFIQYFGMTETNGVVSVLEPHDHDLARPHLLKSVGKPYPALNLKILDASGEPLPANTVGEVCVRTPALMTGYWQNPDATALSRHGEYYRTGDGGYLDGQGYLFLVDRIKDMIVSGGENVYPIEVERALMEHPQVADVAVIGVPDARWGEAVVALVVAAGEAPAPAELIGFARDRVAGFKVPKSIEFLDALPRNAAGKVLKRDLRETYKGSAA